MKFIDILNDVVKTEENSVRYPASPALFEDLGLMGDGNFDDDKFETRVKEYWLYCWYCTDSWVGYTVLFFDNAFVALSAQTARKNSKNYRFVSQEKAKELKAWVVDCCKTDETANFAIISKEELEREESDVLVSVSYSEELFQADYEGFVDGRRVTVLSKSWDKNHLEVLFHDTKEKKTALVESYKFPLRINSAKLLPMPEFKL